MRGLTGLLLFLCVLGGVAAEDLRVGMDTRTPPWSFVPDVDYSREDLTQDPKPSEAQLRRLTGIDVDVARALGQRLQATPRIVPVAWFDEEKQLLAKRYDIIVGAWTPSPKTPTGIVATTSYYEWGLQIAVRAAEKKIRGYGDLGPSVVGHYRDAAAERTLLSLGAQTLKSYDSQDAMFEDLGSGKLDAVLFDSPYVRWRVTRDPAFRAVGEPLNRLGYHAGLRKEDTALFERVQAAVKDLVASGTIAGIRRKWEGR